MLHDDEQQAYPNGPSDWYKMIISFKMAFVFFSDDTQYIILMMYDTMGTLAQNRGEIIDISIRIFASFSAI